MTIQQLQQLHHLGIVATAQQGGQVELQPVTIALQQAGPRPKAQINGQGPLAGAIAPALQSPHQAPPQALDAALVKSQLLAQFLGTDRRDRWCWLWSLGLQGCRHGQLWSQLFGRLFGQVVAGASS